MRLAYKQLGLENVDIGLRYELQINKLKFGIRLQYDPMVQKSCNTPHYFAICEILDRYPHPKMI